LNVLIPFSTLSGDEEEEPPINVTAPTSTSQTLVLLETHQKAEENSPPPQNLQTSTPTISPQAPSPKRARVELGQETAPLTMSSTTVPLEDVSILTTIYVLMSYLCFSQPFLFVVQPLMGQFIRLGTQFIGYRNTVDNLKGIPLVVSRRVNFPFAILS
jgi:hypothetical protein